MMYLFWWQTFIHVIVASTKTIILKANSEAKSKLKAYFFENVFLLSLYIVFIIVFFGWIINFDNRKLLGTNILIMIFQNWTFNFNLILFLINSVFFNKSYADEIKNYSSAFFPRNIILHISIILGAFLHFFFVLKFPHLFERESLWGSFLVATPFLILKIFIDFRTIKSEE